MKTKFVQKHVASMSFLFPGVYSSVVIPNPSCTIQHTSFFFSFGLPCEHLEDFLLAFS